MLDGDPYHPIHYHLHLHQGKDDQCLILQGQWLLCESDPHLPPKAYGAPDLQTLLSKLFLGAFHKKRRGRAAAVSLEIFKASWTWSWATVSWWPAWAGCWARWLPEVLCNLNSSVILWFCVWSSKVILGCHSCEAQPVFWSHVSHQGTGKMDIRAYGAEHSGVINISLLLTVPPACLSYLISFVRNGTTICSFYSLPCFLFLMVWGSWVWKKSGEHLELFPVGVLEMGSIAIPAAVYRTEMCFMEKWISRIEIFFMKIKEWRPYYKTLSSNSHMF